MLRDPRYIPVSNDKLPLCMSIDARGWIGYGGGFGKIVFSHNRFGFNCPFAGIYSSQRTSKGRVHYLKTFYRPTNPQTPTQQAWRSVFTAGKAQYDTFDPETKLEYKIRGKRRGLTGYNLFMSEWLNAHA